MPPVPTQIKSPSGAITLDESATTTVPAGVPLSIIATAGVAGAIYNVLDITGPKVVVVVSGVVDGKSALLPTLAAGSRILEVETRSHGATYAIHKYKLNAVAASSAPTDTNVPVVVPPVVTPVPPTKPPVVVSPVAAVKIGACVDYGRLPTIAPKLSPLGVDLLRCFMPGIAPGGAYGTDHLDPVRRARKASPKLSVMGLHGLKERDASKGRKALPVSEDDNKRYFDAHFAAVAEFGDAYLTEANNEINLTQYLELGGGEENDGKVVPAKVKYIGNVIRIMRNCAGPKPKIYMSSIGWGANAKTSVGYYQAFADDGCLADVDGITQHSYPLYGPDEFEEQLAGIRAIEPNKPLIVSEINVHMQVGGDGKAYFVPLADIPAIWAKFLATAAKYNATLLAFRGEPRAGDPHWSDDRSILKADGTLNTLFVSALGLKAATA